MFQVEAEGALICVLVVPQYMGINKQSSADWRYHQQILKDLTETMPEKQKQTNKQKPGANWGVSWEQKHPFWIQAAVATIMCVCVYVCALLCACVCVCLCACMCV